uniref:Protein tyrosine phosphatase non-receptor type 9b n=1 Tax=Hucho hucho TaxID=62062 RepID=A0A4W5R175_9TELE
MCVLRESLCWCDSMSLRCVTVSLSLPPSLPPQVCTVKAHELSNHIPVSSLPEHLDGTSQYSHVAWIQSCVNTHTAPGDARAHDCVGSLLLSYSLEPHNASASAATLAATQTSIGSHSDSPPLLAYELTAAVNSNCYDDDGNANPHVRRGTVNGRTRGQAHNSPRRSGPQRNHQHWNGSAGSCGVRAGLGVDNVVGVAGSGVVRGANPNANSRQPPPQSDTPPDTPLHHKAVGTMMSDGSESLDDGTANEEEREGEEGEDEVEGVPPLPQKSLPRHPHPPPSQCPSLSSSCGASQPDEDPGEDPCPQEEVSVHMPDGVGMNVLELVEHVKKRKKKGIYQEYEELRKEPPTGSCPIRSRTGTAMSSVWTNHVSDSASSVMMRTRYVSRLDNYLCLKSKYKSQMVWYSLCSGGGGELPPRCYAALGNYSDPWTFSTCCYVYSLVLKLIQ